MGIGEYGKAYSILSSWYHSEKKTLTIRRLFLRKATCHLGTLFQKHIDSITPDDTFLTIAMMNLSSKSKPRTNPSTQKIAMLAIEEFRK